MITRVDNLLNHSQMPHIGAGKITFVERADRGRHAGVNELGQFAVRK